MDNTDLRKRKRYCLKKLLKLLFGLCPGQYGTSCLLTGGDGENFDQRSTPPRCDY